MPPDDATRDYINEFLPYEKQGALSLLLRKSASFLLK